LIDLYWYYLCKKVW